MDIAMLIVKLNMVYTH